MRLVASEARGGIFTIQNPTTNEQFSKTAQIACNGGCQYGNEPATIKLILQDPKPGDVTVDSANIQSGSPPMPRWSYSFQSTQQNPYPAGSYRVEIDVDGQPDTAVQITLY